MSTTTTIGLPLLRSNLLFDIDASISCGNIKIPSQIPGLYCWIDASDPTSISSSNGNVGVAFDKSGNGFHFTNKYNGQFPGYFTGSSILNGLGCIRSYYGADNAGTARTLSSSGSLNLSSNDWTAFVIQHQTDGYSSAQTGRGLSAINNNWLLGMWSAYDNQAYFNNWVYGGGGAGIYLDTTSKTTGPKLYTGRGKTDTTAVLFKVNGRTMFSGSLGNSGPSGVNLSGYGNATEFSYIDTHEVLFYSRSLSDSEVKQIELYLSKKWNVPLTLHTTNLPVRDLTGNCSLVTMVSSSYTYPNQINTVSNTFFLNEYNNGITFSQPTSIANLGNQYTIEWLGCLYARKNNTTNYTIFENEIYQSYGLTFRIDGATRIPYFRTSFSPTYSQISDTVGGEVLAGNYYHYVVTFDYGNMKFYRNGVLTNSTSSMSTQNNSGLNSFYTLGDGQTVQGESCFVRIYNKPLSQSEITNQYNNLLQKINSIPKIVTDNLALWIDAHYYSSYPGVGGTVYDLTTNAYNGTTSSINVTYNNTDPKNFKFNGSSNYIDFGNVLDSTGTSLSGFVWVKIDALQAYTALIDKLTGTGNYRLLAWSDGGIIYGIRNTAGTYQDMSTSGTSNVIPALTWCHVGFTHDSASRTAKIYLNGQFITSSVFSVDRGAVGTSLKTGYQPNNGGYLNGSVASMYIYTKELTQAEVLQNYAATKYRFGK